MGVIRSDEETYLEWLSITMPDILFEDERLPSFEEEIQPNSLRRPDKRAVISRLFIGFKNPEWKMSWLMLG